MYVLAAVKVLNTLHVFNIKVLVTYQMSPPFDERLAQHGRVLKWRRARMSPNERPVTAAVL